MTTLSDLNDEYGIKLKAATEYALQVHVMRYLDGKIKQGRNVIQVVMPFPELVAWHCYNGRSKEEGFFLKELGVMAGVHDVHLMWPDAFATIELKIGKNTQSAYQRTFAMHMQRCRHNTAVCRSVAEVRDTLVGWGLECRNRHVIEPPRSELEKREAAFSMYQRRPDVD